uniref:Ras-related protein Rab n=1 Tax=Oreochromis niloticus TaxID=8128 RepID=A0A669EKC7_ORENI
SGDCRRPAAMQQELLFKVLVIGDLGVGKTSIIKRYVHQIFSQHYRATIGVDFALKVLQWDSNTVIRLQLWDIAGQERYGNMTRVYYREAVGALVVFDVTRASTFDAVLKWKDDLDSKVTLNHGRPVPAVLLANKSDQLVSQQPKLDAFCRENGFVGWFETSAKVHKIGLYSHKTGAVLFQQKLPVKTNDSENVSLTVRQVYLPSSREANGGIPALWCELDSSFSSHLMPFQ